MVMRGNTVENYEINIKILPGASGLSHGPYAVHPTVAPPVGVDPPLTALV